MEISIVKCNDERLSILPEEKIIVSSRFLFSEVTGSELIQALEMFKRQERIDYEMD